MEGPGLLLAGGGFTFGHGCEIVCSIVASAFGPGSRRVHASVHRGMCFSIDEQGISGDDGKAIPL